MKNVEFVEIQSPSTSPTNIDEDGVMNEQLETVYDAATPTNSHHDSSMTVATATIHIKNDTNKSENQYNAKSNTTDDIEQQQQQRLLQQNDDSSLPVSTPVYMDSSNEPLVITTVSHDDYDNTNPNMNSPSKYYYYVNEIVEAKNMIVQHYNKFGTLQPWIDFFMFIKQPQCHATQWDTRITTNYLKYRSNYLTISIVILLFATILTFIILPLVLLIVVPFLTFSFYCLVVNKSSITIGEITITKQGKKYIVLLLLVILLGLTGGLTALIWISLICSVFFLIHMFLSPNDGIVKIQSV